MRDNYRRCIKCVMDTTDPDITFNEEGICNHCTNYDKQLNKIPKGKQAQVVLDDLIYRIKKDGKSKDYDCVIGLSGGVDSTFVAYLIKEKFGLRPLAVHLDNGWNSELSVVNMENIVKILNIDLYTHVIDWEEFKDIQLSFLKSSTPDLEVPTDHAIFSILRQIAKKFKIKYIINGINVRTESHHALAWSQGHSDFGYIKGIQKKFGTRKIKTFPHGNRLSIFEELFSKKWISILNYIDYDKNEAKRIITEKLNWRDYGGKHYESTYTKFYQGYILPKKFGYDKRKMHFSSLICAGVLTREEALYELKKEPYPIHEQLDDREYFIKKFKITPEIFEEIMNLPSKSYYDYPSYYGKILKSRYLPKIKKALEFLLVRSKSDVNL